MFCSSCGKLMPDGSAFCPQCGRPSGAAVSSASAGAVAAAVPAVAPPYVPASPAGPVAAAPGLVYAGFWLRLVAYLIDALILGLCFGTVFVLLAIGAGLGNVLQNLQNGPDLAPFFAGTFFATLIFFFLATFVVSWIYYAWMESSRFQGTLGKMALGLIVTDMQCRPVSFARASGRFFSRLITNLIPLFIGYIMAGFTEKKQALHDIIASCLVLRRI